MKREPWLAKFESIDAIECRYLNYPLAILVARYVYPCYVSILGNSAHRLLKVNFNSLVLVANNLEMAIEYVIKDNIEISSE